MVTFTLTVDSPTKVLGENFVFTASIADSPIPDAQGVIIDFYGFMSGVWTLVDSQTINLTGVNGSATFTVPATAIGTFDVKAIASYQTYAPMESNILSVIVTEQPPPPPQPNWLPIIIGGIILFALLATAK